MARLLVFPVVVLAPFIVSYALVIAGTTGSTRRRLAAIGPSARQNAAMRIARSNPVLAVHDLDQSGAWYRDVLGCELEDMDPGNWGFCRAGGVTFMLGRCPDVPAAGELGDHSYVAYLHVDDVDGFHRTAVAAGAEVLKAPRDEPWGMRELGLRSPDGHRFMLGQPTEPT